MNVWSNIENVLNSALSMSLSSLSRSNEAANGIRIEECLDRFFTIIRMDRFNTAKEISYRDT